MDQGIFNITGRNSSVASGVGVSNPAQALLLPKYRSGLAGIQAGIANASLLYIGDSTTVGAGSNGSLSTGDEKALSVSSQFCNLFRANGLNAHVNSVRCDGFTPNFSSTMDPRMTVGSSWTQGSGTSQAFCGGDAWAASTTTNALSFKPKDVVDTFVVRYFQNPGAGSISIDIDGGTPTVQSTNGGSTALGTVNVTAPLGIHQVNVKYSSGSTVYMLGFDAYDSSKKWLNIINAGWFGSQVTHWQAAITNNFVSNPFNESQHLTMIKLGINDWNNGTPLATFRLNLQNIVAKCLLAGDVILCSPNPTGGAITNVTQQLYVDVISQVAQANNILFIDNFSRWVSYANSTPYNFYFDSTHPGGRGYADITQSEFAYIGIPGEGYSPSLSANNVLATIGGIDGTTIANTLAWTNATGRTAVVTGANVRCTAATAITVPPSAGVGTSAGTSDIFPSVVLTGLTVANKVFGFELTAIAAVVPNAGTVYFNLGTGAVGTAQTLAIDLAGYTVV